MARQILAVEDSPTQAEVLRGTLEAAGYEATDFGQSREVKGGR